MVRTVFAEHFQGIEYAKIKMGPVTQLIGRNGAGKTSLAEAIEFLLLGEPVRGGVLSDVIQDGASGCEVEVVLDDDARTTLGRKRTMSGSTVTLINDGTVSSVDFDAAVATAIGEKPAIRSALRSGGLLNMKPKDLQQFLVDLTGARFDAEGIAEALGEEVAAAAERRELSLPTDLEDFEAKEKTAVADRRDSKRRHKDRVADFERAPAPTVIPEEDVVEVDVKARIKSLRAEKESAIRAEAACSASASEQRENLTKSLSGRIAELEPLVSKTPPTPKRASTAIQAELTAAQRAASDADSALTKARATAEEVRELAAKKTDADDKLAAELPALRKAFSEARHVREEAEQKERNDASDLKHVETQLASAPDEGECAEACDHCSVAQSAQFRSELEAKLSAASAKAEESKKQLTAAKSTEDTAKVAGEKAAAANERVVAAEQLKVAIKQIATHMTAASESRAKEATLAAEFDKARELERDAKKATERQEELAQARSQLAELEKFEVPQPPTVSSETLEKQVTEAESLLDDVRKRDVRLRAAKGVSDEAANVRDADKVAKALGPTGAKATLIANGVKPFIDACNTALETFDAPWRVAIDAANFGVVAKRGDTMFRPEQLSDGHRMRLLYAIQYAVARLAGVGFVTFDRVELLDDGGRTTLDALVSQCSADGIQVLMLQHGEPPETVAAGMLAYSVNGATKRIPEAA